MKFWISMFNLTFAQNKAFESLDLKAFKFNKLSYHNFRR
jgi:hypothetical protein